MLVTVFCLLNVAVLALAGDESQQCPYDDEEEPWSYRGENGPDYWGTNYPTSCGNGKEQSPIDIDTLNDTKDSIQLEMENCDIPIGESTVENNGHTIQVTPKDGVKRTIIVYGERYHLKQCHFHWGCKQGIGSEHTIDNTTYEMEAHCVHVNEKDENDLAVVAIIFEEVSDTEGDAPPAELQKIVNVLHEIRFKNESSWVSDLDVSCLSTLTYYPYDGSLTTPGCDEGVKWFVAREHFSVTHSQIEEFRNLYPFPRSQLEIWDYVDLFFMRLFGNRNCNLCDNFRPIQELNGREIHS